MKPIFRCGCGARALALFAGRYSGTEYLLAVCGACALLFIDTNERGERPARAAARERGLR